MFRVYLVMMVFGDIQVDDDGHQVWRDGEPVDLEPKAIRVLLYLIENRHRVVPKQEIFDRVWGDVEVTDNALTRVIGQLRKGLGDDAKHSRYVETIPTVGYRFIGLETRDKTNSPARWIAAAILTLVAAGAAWMLVTKRTPVVASSFPLRLRQVTSSRTLDASPTYSPDGRTIAYSSDRTGQFEIYLRPADGVGREIQITDDGGGNLEASFSPDGATIAFHSLSRGGIYLIPATGGPVRQLTSFGSQPSWSPDGKRIAFRSTNLISLAPLDSVTIFPGQIGIVEVESGTMRLHGGDLTRTTPSWTPDGKWILFMAPDPTPSSQIRVLNVASGESHDLVRGHGALLSPVASPDQRWIYYSRLEKAGGSTILRQAVDPETMRAEGDPQPIATPAGYAQQLALTRDGKRLAISLISMDSNLWMLPAGSTTPRPLTQNSNYRNTMPCFSPDGEWISFQTRRVGGPVEVWLIRPDGTNTEMVENDTSGGWMASWHPRNGHLRYVRLSDRKMIEFDLATRAKRVSPHSVPGIGAQRTLPDGEMLMHRIEGGQLRIGRWNPDSGQLRWIATGSNAIGFPTVSPDGKLLAAELMSNEATHMVILPIEGGKAQQLTEGAELAWPHSWSPDQRRIAFAGQRGGAWNVYWVDRQTRETKRLTNYQSARSYVRYPAWSPKNDALVYEFTEVKGNVYELDLR